MSRKPRSLGQLEASTISWLIVSKSMRNACTEIWIEICAPHTSTSSSTGNSNYGEYYQRVVELFKNCVSNCIVRIIENIYIRNKNIRLNTFFFPMCVELMKSLIELLARFKWSRMYLIKIVGSYHNHLNTDFLSYFFPSFKNKRQCYFYFLHMHSFLHVYIHTHIVSFILTLFNISFNQ